MQPLGYALSATRPKETLWAESALGPAKREPFVNSFIMRRKAPLNIVSKRGAPQIWFQVRTEPLGRAWP